MEISGFSKATLRNIKKHFNEVLQEFAEDVAFNIEKAYESVIDMFYADYGPNNGDPWFYDRTYSTYQASSGYDQIFSSNNIQHYGNSYFSGIGVSSSNIPGDPYKAYKEWVFNRTFYKGIHGISSVDVREKNEQIRQKYKRQRALMRKLKKKHKGLKIDSRMQGLIKNIPKNMNPAPKKVMDRQFKKITKKSNMDVLFREALSHMKI